MSRKEPNAGKIARREALKLVIAGMASAPLAGTAATRPAARRPRGTPADPDLVNPVVPWKALLTRRELKTVTALCDLILPADEVSPAASAVGVPEFIDEWVSAPYPTQKRDLETVRDGLGWIDAESAKRSGKAFHELAAEQRTAICDDIHHRPDAAPEFRRAADFFDRFRWLTMAGFYTTEAGRRDLKFIGNVPLDKFPGATPEQLKHLDLL